MSYKEITLREIDISSFSTILPPPPVDNWPVYLISQAIHRIKRINGFRYIFAVLLLRISQSIIGDMK